jgi:hypothetical protein
MPLRVAMALSPETVPAQRAPGFRAWKDPVGAYSLRPAPVMDVGGLPIFVAHASAAGDYCWRLFPHPCCASPLPGGEGLGVRARTGSVFCLLTPDS